MNERHADCIIDPPAHERPPTQAMAEIDLAAAEQVSGGSLLWGFAIGMLIDHYLIKPLWNN